MVSRQGEPAVAVCRVVGERLVLCMVRAIAGGFIPPTQASNNATAVRAGGEGHDPPSSVFVSHAHPVIYLSPGFSSQGKVQTISWPFVLADA